MKVSGFTFLRNAASLGYPFVESIRSILPLVDEMVVNVGSGVDDTLDQVRAIGSAKLRIVESHWNEGMEQRGFVYAQQKMIAQYNCTGDWAFYLEGDEVLHEAELDRIRNAMVSHLGDPRIEALAFAFHHFYGVPQQVAVSPAWYRREVRIIRNTIRSYAPDGLFWLVMDRHRRGRYPRAAMTGAHIYHYGHVRKVEAMRRKHEQVSRFWSHAAPSFPDYGRIDPQALAAYSGSHPELMQRWLAEEAEREFSLDAGYSISRRERKHRLAMKLERALGIDLSKKHFRLVAGAAPGGPTPANR